MNTHYNNIAPHNQQIRKFSGYTSVLNVQDAYNDYILPKAFSKSLLYANKGNLLWGNMILKKLLEWLKLKKIDTDYILNGHTFLNLPHAKNVYELIDLMKINHMSIGYRVNNCYRKMGLRYIKEVELCEISLSFKAS
ncbi:MAG: HK97 family phage prohead protease [Candidatus Midichloria sp.]|nr:HK97 family phage prohead protease [Candidatus Midichloria sp.]